MLQILNDLAATNSRIAKEAILKKLTPEQVSKFKEVAYAAYYPLVNYWVVKYDEPETYAGEISLSNAISSLEALTTRSVTGHAAVNFLTVLAGKLTADDAEVLRRIISHDLRCGATATLFNKMWKGFIPEFELMACHTLNEKTEKKFKFPAYGQIKYDAARVAVMVKDGVVDYRTRNGKTYQIENPSLDAIFLEAATKFGENVVFDGELYQMKADGSPENRLVSNGVATKFIRGSAEPTHHANAGIALWDVVSLEDFLKGKSDIIYEVRFANLGFVIGKSQQVILAENEIVMNLQGARALAARHMKDGLEGAIIKAFDGIWEAKRSNSCLKVKAIRDADLLVTGLEEGSGKNVGKLGALVCQSVDSLVKVNVGIGFSDEQREFFWKNPDQIVGKIVAVEYNELVQSSTSNVYSLFLPRFIEVRDDKNVADDLTKILDSKGY